MLSDNACDQQELEFRGFPVILLVSQSTHNFYRICLFCMLFDWILSTKQNEHQVSFQHNKPLIVFTPSLYIFTFFNFNVAVKFFAFSFSFEMHRYSKLYIINYKKFKCLWLNTVLYDHTVFRILMHASLNYRRVCDRLALVFADAHVCVWVRAFLFSCGLRFRNVSRPFLRCL